MWTKIERAGAIASIALLPLIVMLIVSAARLNRELAIERPALETLQTMAENRVPLASICERWGEWKGDLMPSTNARYWLLCRRYR